MKKAVKIVSVVVAISLLLVSFCGCNMFKSDEQLIRERVEEFLSSYNSGDMDGTFECFDATTRNIMGVDESQEDIQMEMVKEDGDWYINGQSGSGLF